jgi:hypothetical protein
MVRKNQNNTISELALKHGSISVRALRDFYGSFAPHCADDSKLSEILADLDVASLTQSFGIIRADGLNRFASRAQDQRAKARATPRYNGDKGL